MKVAALLVFTTCFISSVFSEELRFVPIPDDDGDLHLHDLHATEPRTAVDPEEDISLQLFTKRNPTTPQKIQIESNNIPDVFNKSAQTRFIFHGWLSNFNKMVDVTEAYLSESEYVNIVVVDWSGPANKLYTSAKESTKEVGVYVGKVIRYLVDQGVDLNNIQVIGHSLGAHIAGIIGKELDGALPMITGLDPAAPLYGWESLETRLDSSDAKFVQVIHTCAGLLGWADPMGHADFYPNGGHIIQPGCGIDLGSVCSHNRSRQLFAESINSTIGFTAHQCESEDEYKRNNCDNSPEANMGEHVSLSANGKYFLKTASTSPFALGA